MKVLTLILSLLVSFVFGVSNALVLINQTDSTLGGTAIQTRLKGNGGSKQVPYDLEPGQTKDFILKTSDYIEIPIQYYISGKGYLKAGATNFKSKGYTKEELNDPYFRINITESSPGHLKIDIPKFLTNH